MAQIYEKFHIYWLRIFPKLAIEVYAPYHIAMTGFIALVTLCFFAAWHAASLRDIRSMIGVRKLILWATKGFLVLAAGAYGLYLSQIASAFFFSSSYSIVRPNLAYELPGMIGFVLLLFVFSHFPSAGRRYEKLAVSFSLGIYFSWSFLGLLINQCHLGV